MGCQTNGEIRRLLWARTYGHASVTVRHKTLAMKGGRVPEPEVQYRYECGHNSYLTLSLDFEAFARIPRISVPYAIVNVGVLTKDTKYNESKKHSLNYSTTVVLDDSCVNGNMSKYYNVLGLVEQ